MFELRTGTAHAVIQQMQKGYYPFLEIRKGLELYNPRRGYQNHKCAPKLKPLDIWLLTDIIVPG
jgi:hypothetical protein